MEPQGSQMSTVTIVGTPHPGHIADSVPAAELSLSEVGLERIDRITARSVAMTGAQRATVS
jgi:hypothetical protein